MKRDLYLICSESETFTVTRQQAEAFLINRIGFNAPAAELALNGVRDCGDHVNLREGYVIRRPLVSYAIAAERAAARLKKGMTHADYRRIIDQEVSKAIAEGNHRRF